MNISGQDNWCGSDQYNEELYNSLSELEKASYDKAFNKQFEGQFSGSQNQKSGPIITVPVVVHVMHYDCNGNISKAQIEDGIRVLNEDFRRVNSDTSSTRALFKPHTGDAEIEFKLAQLDPSGNCTEGIVRYNTPLTYEARNNVKSLSYWPSNRYLNVWLVETIENTSGSSGTILGFAQFPGFGSASTYGLVVRNDQWGSIGTSNSDGRTATHEVGHCFGLLHTFQSGCGNSCTNSGDRICDTPPTTEATYGCNTNQNTCANDANGSGSPYNSNVVDQIENYMSYDRCQNMFSNGQIAVMRDAFTQYSRLSNLVSSSNLASTGTDPGFTSPDCKPIAFSCQQEITICEGASVTFTDDSYNGPVNSRSWSFPGGNPASSSAQTVTVTYTSAGTYSATLTVGNGSGSDTESMNDVVHVEPSVGDFSNWRYDEFFENEGQFDSLWSVDNTSGGREWELTNSAAFSGVNSVYIKNYINGLDLTDNLISPSYDMSAVNQPILNLKVAYARRDVTSLDYLRIHYSYDCGTTWNFITVLTGTLLESVGDFRTSEFFPASGHEWRDFSFKLSQSIKDQTNVRFRFEFTSGGGNNIFIDDVSVTSATGINDFETNNSVKIYPNPAESMLFVDLSGHNSDVKALEIFDIAGRKISMDEMSKTMINQDKYQLDVSNLVPGIYYLQVVDASNQRMVKKFVVN